MYKLLEREFLVFLRLKFKKFFLVSKSALIIVQIQIQNISKIYHWRSTPG